MSKIIESDNFAKKNSIQRRRFKAVSSSLATRASSFQRNPALWLFDFLGMILRLLEPTFECLNQFNKKRSNPLSNSPSSKISSRFHKHKSRFGKRRRGAGLSASTAYLKSGVLASYASLIEEKEKVGLN